MIAIHPLPSIAEVEALWRAMAPAARHSFFVSWPWIHTWLTCLPAAIKPHLLTVTQGGLAIGVGLLVKRRLWRNGVINSRTWLLNATGDPELDRIFIEDNGLVAREGYDEAAWKLWAQAFTEQCPDWDEVELRGVRPGRLAAWEGYGMRLREEMAMTSRYVELDQVRDSRHPYLQLLGKKTRAHVRKTAQAFEKHGPIVVQAAQSPAEALVFFGELKTLHQQRWAARGMGGAFVHPFFELFHASLIQQHFSAGVIQLLRVKAGEQTIGVLYNFLHANDVLVYQTGFNYALVESPNKESPGLLTHALAIDHNTQLGFRRYDFLAGDSQYKQALATASEQLWWGAIQRDRAKFRFEDQLRTLWRQVTRRA